MWLSNFFTRHFRPTPPSTPPTLEHPKHHTRQCVNCDKQIHRNDRWRVLKAEHVDCADPRGVGEQALPMLSGGVQ